MSVPKFEKITLENVKVINVPEEKIIKTLEAESHVHDVRTKHTSSFPHGTKIEAEVTEDCVFHLIKTIRDLGLYIESFYHFPGEGIDEVHLRRMVDTLEEMEQQGHYDGY